VALNWVDFTWSLKRWLSLYPLSFVTSLPNTTLGSGSQTLTNEQYALTASNSTAATWTLPSPSDNTGHVFRIKNQGAGELTLSSPYIFTDSVVSTLILVKGDMVTLRSDGAYWNVGD
jgi:hypothetical protein